MTRRPTPHDPPQHQRTDAWGLVGGYYVPPGCARPIGEARAADAPGGIPASLLAYPGPGSPAASGDATTDPRPDRTQTGPGGGDHP